MFEALNSSKASNRTNRYEPIWIHLCRGYEGVLENNLPYGGSPAPYSLRTPDLCHAFVWRHYRCILYSTTWIGLCLQLKLSLHGIPYNHVPPFIFLSLRIGTREDTHTHTPHTHTRTHPLSAGGSEADMMASAQIDVAYDMTLYIKCDTWCF